MYAVFRFQSLEQFLSVDVVDVRLSEDNQILTDVSENVAVALTLAGVYLQPVFAQRRQTNRHQYLCRTKLS